MHATDRWGAFLALVLAPQPALRLPARSTARCNQHRATSFSRPPFASTWCRSPFQTCYRLLPFHHLSLHFTTVAHSYGRITARANSNRRSFLCYAKYYIQWRYQQTCRTFSAACRACPPTISKYFQTIPVPLHRTKFCALSCRRIVC